MSSDTARKIVVATLLVGSAAIAYDARTQGTATMYRRIWGLSLLTAGGAIVADAAPAAAGPYMVLVLLGFLLSNKTGLGGLISEASSAVQKGGTQ
jgi:hypothetical protein